MLLNKAAINAATDIATRDVPVPQLGGDVRIRALSVGDLDAITAQENLSTARRTLLIVAVSIVDETGQRLFADSEVDELGRRSPEAIKVLSDAIAELNGWSAGAAEAIAKN